MKGTVEVTGALDSALKDSIVKSVQEQAQTLLSTIGPRVAAVGLGLADARPVKTWASGDVEPREHLTLDRLRLLYVVTQAVGRVYEAPSVAVGFLRSANPQLDDESPLRVIADDPEGNQAALLGALRAFLEG